MGGSEQKDLGLHIVLMVGWFMSLGTQRNSHARYTRGSRLCLVGPTSLRLNPAA